MNRRRFFSLLALATLTTAASGNPASQNETQKSIRAEYERYRQAILRKDMDSVVGMLTPDFVWKMRDGSSLDRKQTAKLLKEQIQAVKTVQSMQITLHRITLQGDRAVVLLTETTSALLRGPDGKAKPATSTEHYRETWVKSAARWKRHKAETLPAASVARAR
jgi:ketosteroid isomerase-like protein